MVDRRTEAHGLPQPQAVGTAENRQPDHHCFPGRPHGIQAELQPRPPRGKVVEIPVRDYTAPTVENLLHFLQIVEESPGTVLVHCEGGNGRTGTFGAAWLMRTGEIWATRAIELLRENNPEAVETDEQKAVLIGFEKRLKAIRKFDK